MLTNKEIKKQIELGNIVIENLQEDALNKPNSCDLRLGNTLYVFDYDIIDTKNATNIPVSSTAHSIAVKKYQRKGRKNIAAMEQILKRIKRMK